MPTSSQGTLYFLVLFDGVFGFGVKNARCRVAGPRWVKIKGAPRCSHAR